VVAYKEQRWGARAQVIELQRWRERSAKVHASGRDAPLARSQPGPPLAEADLPARGVTYARGALALHKLRGELGDALFWAGIQRYVRDRAGRGARSEDLRAAFEASSGRDLRAWFERWVYTPAPDL
jgi:aminopeptidase N